MKVISHNFLQMACTLCLILPFSMAGTPTIDKHTVMLAEDGLMWLRNADLVGEAQMLTGKNHSASTLIAQLNAGAYPNGNYANWRLPTTAELNTLFSRISVADPGPFKHIQYGLYQTRETDGKSDVVRHGPVEAAKKGAPNLVWAVRNVVESADLANTVMLGVNSALLQYNAEVKSGDVIANTAYAGPTNAGEQNIFLAEHAATPVGYAVMGDRIDLTWNTHIRGTVHYSTLNSLGTIERVAPLTGLPVITSLPAFQVAHPSTTDVLVGFQTATTLTPGSYGDIMTDTDCMLILEPGEYDIASLTVHTRSTLQIKGPVTVRIAGKMEVKWDSDLVPAPDSGLTAKDIVFYVGGSGDNGALVGPNGQFHANIYAPNGTIRVDHNSSFYGSMIGMDVELGEHSAAYLDAHFSGGGNKAPSASADHLIVAEGADRRILRGGATSVLDNDIDPEENNMTAELLEDVLHGTLDLNLDGTFTYVHGGSETTDDHFIYLVCDDADPVACSTATVYITIAPVNDAPRANNDSLTVVRGGATNLLDTSGTNLLANDTDTEDHLRFLITEPVLAPRNGDVTLNPDGTFIYTHNGGTKMNDHFIYRACDNGLPSACDIAQVTIRVELKTDNAAFSDFNGDGVNSVEDLFDWAALWRSSDQNDADGDGMMTIKDGLFIDTGKGKR